MRRIFAQFYKVFLWFYANYLKMRDKKSKIILVLWVFGGVSL